MKLSIPCLYASYGRYIEAYRAIPSNIDGLKISTRRALLSLYDKTKDKHTKSAKVVGHMIGTYHPHGDLSAYDTIFKLVLHDYALGEGAWGSYDKDGVDPPAAQRYTECKLSPWVRELAFKYIKNVPWINLELDDEPLYLPCPIPIGLIGFDNITGVAFHRTVIPKYKKEDLATRMKWLIENAENYTGDFDENNLSEEVCGPLIKPNFRDCECKESLPGEFYKLLFNGEGVIRVIPKGQIFKDKIKIQGRVPLYPNYKTLERDIDNGKLDVTMIDFSGKTGAYDLEIDITPKKKSTDIKQLFKLIWTKYLIKNINYKCYFVDREEIPTIQGIDEILINNYNGYTEAVLNYRINIFRKLNEKCFENYIIQLLQNIIKKYDIKSIDDVIKYYNKEHPKQLSVQLKEYKDNQFNDYYRDVFEKDIIDVCNSNSITKLVNAKIDINKINQEVQDCEQSIFNVYVDCYEDVKNLI